MTKQETNLHRALFEERELVYRSLKQKLEKKLILDSSD